MTYFDLTTIFALGLACYRLARVVAHDKIGQPIRDRAYKAAAEHGRAGRWLNSRFT